MLLTVRSAMDDSLPASVSPKPRERRGRRTAVAIGTAGGVGFVPLGPGTAASLVPGIPLAWALAQAAPWAGLASAALLFLAGWWAAGVCEDVFGRKDPPRVVIDEVAGILISVAWLPATWGTLAGGFILFRLFDIVKPPPVGLIDRKVGGGLGVMLDDVVAGCFARLVLEAVLRLA